MAVYTEVDRADAAALFERLGLGPLIALEGIGDGIENTNYDATTTGGRWVLTLFERLEADELPYYLRLMQHLAGHGVPVPWPRPDDQGHLVHRLSGKPAAVVTRLPGSHRMAPDADHCAQVGAMLARMHLASLSAPLSQPNPRGLAWCEATATVVDPHLTVGQRELLVRELDWQRSFDLSPGADGLPGGAVHADLFRDNVVFDRHDGSDRLSGFFDFYFAGSDRFLLDIAVCLNDWCTEADSAAIAAPLARALVGAYAAVRPVGPDERRALPTFLRRAALRFWLSRLHDRHRPRDAALLHPKDPDHFERVLRDRAAAPEFTALESGPCPH